MAKLSMKVGTVSVHIETIGDDALLQFKTAAGVDRALRLVQWDEMQAQLKRISGLDGPRFFLLLQEFLQRIIAGTDNTKMHISPETLECVLQAHFPEIYKTAVAK